MVSKKKSWRLQYLHIMCAAKKKVVENFHLITHDKYCHKEWETDEEGAYDNVIKKANVMDILNGELYAILHNAKCERTKTH